MGINKDKNKDISDTITYKNYHKNIAPFLSKNDLMLTKTIIDEVNANGYFIQDLFQLSWMDEEDYEVIDRILVRYALKFERKNLRNGVIAYLGKKENYFATEFLIETFKEARGDEDQETDWSMTLRAVSSSALLSIKDKTRIDDYISLINDVNTRKDTHYLILLLGELKAKRAIPFLIDLLNEDNAALQSAAIQALGHFKKTVDLEAIISPFLKSENEILREYAKKVLK